MSWLSGLKEKLPMSVQKQLTRTNEGSATASPALVRYHNPKTGPKYPEELLHLPFRTRPSKEQDYKSMQSAHKNICYEEIDNLDAPPKASEKFIPTGKWYVIHPLDQVKIERLNLKYLAALKAWITGKDIYKGTDLQSQMFLEARKETLARVEKEIFRRECGVGDYAGIKVTEDEDEVVVGRAEIEEEWVFVSPNVGR